jgi:NTP pyrophosphatase (non-canonical NTP hydrolase)
MTPEERARQTIDQLLTAAGWAVQDVKQADLHAARGGGSLRVRARCNHRASRFSSRQSALSPRLIESTAMTDTLEDLAQQLRQFAKARDWQQFHSPKNLASALIVEAGELLEHFQWMTDEQSRDLPPEKRDAVAAEAADVLLYLIQLTSVLGIDPVAAAQGKLKLNELKYPVERARGSSKKYDEL